MDDGSVKRGRNKVINDDIWGNIELASYLVDFIDTPSFKRWALTGNRTSNAPALEIALTTRDVAQIKKDQTAWNMLRSLVGFYATFWR